MLRSLAIRDFVIVDRLELAFEPGFTVLSGETGAGKSILIDALGMVLGERADAVVVRAGAARAEVEAEFEAAPEALERWLADNDLAGDAGRVLLRRVIDPSGRSRGFINGRAATLAQLREAGEHLVDVHGQHEHQSLLRTAAQRALLDAHGGLDETAVRVQSLHRAWQAARERRKAFEEDASRLAAERDRLEWQVRELEALKPQSGEWGDISAEHTRLAHAASLIESAQQGADALSESDESALARLNAVLARLAGQVAHDTRLQEVIGLLESARIELQEGAQALRRYGDRLEVDPARLREVERRLDALHAAARKYRVQPEELAQALDGARARLDELEGAGDIETLGKQEEEALAACLAQARKLSAARKRAAARLAQEVTGSMQSLAMAGGRFEIALHGVEPVAAHGLENVEFLVSAHKGMAPQPLAKVASGGELSRLSLAIQTVASRHARVPTLIFDEVDAGIGGRVAEIVGRMLRELGARHQVMCITHLPQVAAMAAHQWQVTKVSAGGTVLSQVSVLDETQRIEEIARMLGGVKITETTRRHAAEMLRAVNRES